MARASKAQRMDLLAGLAQKREDQIATVLSQAQQALVNAQNQLESLKEYEQNYLRNFRGAMQGSLSSYNLSGYQQFIAQVSDAIDQQKTVLEQAQIQVDRVREEWVFAREKRKSLERLRDEENARQARATEKKEEARILDDYVASRYR